MRAPASAKPVGVMVRVVETRERRALHDLLVADADDRRGLESLFGGDDVDGPQKPIALAGIDALLVARSCRERRGEFGRSAKFDWLSRPR